MLFSVVIPLFNKEDFICRAIESVLAQDCPDFELIIVDDGSTDEGPSRVQPYLGDQVQLITQVNQGVSAARNAGVSAAQGGWIALLDADDYWEPSFLSEIKLLLEEFPAAGLCCTGYAKKKAGELVPAAVKLDFSGPTGLISDYFSAACCRDLPVTASSVAVRREVLAEVDGFPVGWSMGEDLHVWMKIALRHPIACSRRSLAVYDYSDAQSATHSHKVLQILPHVSALEAWLAGGAIDERLVPGATELLHRSYIFTAFQNIKAGHSAQARALLRSPHVRWSAHYLLSLALCWMPSALAKGIIKLSGR